MSKRISGAEYPLSKIFSAEFDYLIPSYQRPYAWTETQAGELFSDLYDFFLKEKDDTYFLGSIVLIKEEGKPRAEVIDGQQRLTTLTLLFAALAHRATGTIRDSLLKYLCEPGDVLEGLPQKPRLTLRERDRDFFKQYIQDVQLDALPQIDPAQLENESQRNIRANALLLLERLRRAFGDDQTALTAFGAFLVQRCFLVAVSTPSQQSAFRVFSVLNSRGLDLLPTDIIKSDVIGSIPTGLQAEYNEVWEELEVDAGRDGFAEVFGHIRMIYAKEKARRALLEEFRERVAGKLPSSAALIDQVIKPYTDAYLVAKQSSYTSTSNAADVNALLRWLNRIDNSDWLPAVMRFLADKSAHAEYVLWFVRRLERLTSFMYLCGYDVNARIDRYAEILSALEGPHSLELPVVAVELKAGEKETFRRALDGPVYELPAKKRNYLILRLDSFVSDSAASYDSTLLTIEHVLPQTVNAGSLWAQWWPDVAARQTWVHRLANLVPLNRHRNSAAQNYDFDVKKSKYFKGQANVSSYALTTQVLSESEWTPDVVAARQRDLLKKLCSEWELE